MNKVKLKRMFFVLSLAVTMLSCETKSNKDEAINQVEQIEYSTDKEEELTLEKAETLISSTFIRELPKDRTDVIMTSDQTMRDFRSNSEFQYLTIVSINEKEDYYEVEGQVTFRFEGISETKGYEARIERILDDFATTKLYMGRIRLYPN